jgi:BASS family bile acid:Na+ symporter
MSLDAIVRLSLLLSIWLMVLSLGARASMATATHVLRRPAALARALVAMFVVVPAFAVLLAWAAPVAFAVRFALVAMSVGPVPPILAHKQIKAAGDEDYAIGLLVAASLASIVLTPPLVALAARLLSANAEVAPLQVARTLLLTVGLPLAAGIGLRAASSAAADAVSGIAQRVGGLVLLAGLVVLVAGARSEILALFGNGAALAIVAMVAVGLLAGHLLAGPRHRAALALAAASRHPGVAMAIAQASYPEQRKPIAAALLLYLLITALVTAPYVRWTRRQAAALEPAGGPAA